MNPLQAPFSSLVWLSVAILASAGAKQATRRAERWPPWLRSALAAFPAGQQSTLLAALGAAVVPAAALFWRVPGMRPALWGLGESAGPALSSHASGWWPWIWAVIIPMVTLAALTMTTRRLLGRPVPAANRTLGRGAASQAMGLVFSAACLELYWAFCRAAVLSLGEARPVLSVAASLAMIGLLGWLADVSADHPSDPAAEVSAMRRAATAVQSACLFLLTGQFLACLAAHVALAAAGQLLAPLPAPPAVAAGQVTPIALDIEPTVV